MIKTVDIALQTMQNSLGMLVTCIVLIMIPVFLISLIFLSSC